MSATDVTTDRLAIGGRELGSRLLLGTGGFRSLDALAAAIEASGAELVTVALRRVDPSARGSIVDVLDEAGVELLPNTAGCFTARDAVLTARLAREAFETSWVKLEVIGDERTLLPDAPAPPPRGGPASPTAPAASPAASTRRPPRPRRARRASRRRPARAAAASR